MVVCGLRPLKFFLVFFVVKIKKDYAVIRDRLAIFTMIVEPTVFFPAKLAPVINNTVITAPNVFFIPAIVKPGHFSVGLLRFEE